MTASKISNSIGRLSENLRIPVIAAPMFLVSTPALVIEASRSGIIGSFPAPNARTAADLRDWLTTITDGLEQARTRGEKPAAWAMNMITHQTYSRFEEELDLIREFQPGLVITALGGPKRVVDTVHSYGGLVFADVINPFYARKATEAGADGLVLVCAGAGGHTGSYSHFAFIEEVRKFFDGPIALSGAISNGKAIRAAEILGADLAYIGTPFIATYESMAPPAHKEMVVDKSISDLIQSRAVTGALGNWLQDSLVSSGFDMAQIDSKAKIDFSGDMQSGSKAWKDIFSAGQALGQVEKILHTGQIVDRLALEYHNSLYAEKNEIDARIGSLTAHDVAYQNANALRPAFSSPVDMFWYAVHTFPDTVALIEGEQSLTYKELGLAVITLEKSIAEKIKATGKKIEDTTVAIFLPNSIRTVVSVFAALNIGAKVSLHNPLLSHHEVSNQFSLVNASLLITDAAHHDGLEKGAAFIPPQVIAMNGAIYFEKDLALPDLSHAGSRDDGATILYLFTGGTTGIPKAVEHTHASVIAAIRGMEYAWPTLLNKETWVSVSPMTHIYGLLYCLFDPIYSASTNVLAYPFHSATTIEALQKHKGTIYSGGPPATYSALLKGDQPLSFPYLRLAGGGGAPFPIELLKQLKDRLGIQVTEAYGMTEMSPITCHDTARGYRAGSVGKKGLSVDIKIIDIDTQQELPAGATGMILIRGRQQMKGYAQNVNATAETVKDGWIITGDMGSLDTDGFLYITGRTKEMINVSGYKVFPREIDEKLMAVPGVLESCTLAVSDDMTGEAVYTALVVNSDVFSQDLLKHYIDGNFTAYKQPKHIEIVDAIPRTGANKPDRLGLRKRFEEKIHSH